MPTKQERRIGKVLAKAGIPVGSVVPDSTSSPARKVEPLPDLSRTKAALIAYDAFDAIFETTGSQETVVAQFAELERLGKAVGTAFGLDTADRNSLSTCEGAIRPGPKVPGNGCTPSFVRRMVAQWEARNERR